MNSMDGMISQLQTGQMPVLNLGRRGRPLTGMQVLDLTTAEPEATRNLTLRKSDGAAFQKGSRETQRESAWQVFGAEKGLEIDLTLPYKHGVNLIVELCRTASGPAESPVTLTVNEAHSWGIEISPHNLEFHRQSWYVPQYMLEKGKNRLSLRLAPDAGGDVLVKRVAVMRFDLQMQEQTNWCWAAVTTSLLTFFHPDEPRTQCEIVRETLRDTEHDPEEDCCGTGKRDLCNRVCKLPDALDSMGLLSIRCNYPLELHEIRQQIDLGLPLAIRIEWKKGGGHFVMITGVLPQDPRGDGHTWIRIADPLRESAVYITYNALKKRYRGDGEWTHTYMFEAERTRR